VTDRPSHHRERGAAGAYAPASDAAAPDVEEMAMLEGTTRVPTLRALVNRRVASWNGCEF
jgi:hypothetical protein